MTRSLSITRWGGAFVGALLLTLATLGASAAIPKRVLMVFREASNVPATRMIEQAVRDKLQTPEAGGIEIYTEYLDANRFAGETHYELFREYLREKYNNRRPDVIVMVLTPAFDLAGVPPGELIPGVPAVFIAVNAAPLPDQPMGTNVTGIVARPDVRGTVDLIFRLQPDTRRIVVVGGIAAIDRMVVAQAAEASRAYRARAEFEFWTNRPMTELQPAAAKLSAGTVVLFASIFQDVSGRAMFPAEAGGLLAEAASVPVYVWADSVIGSGAIGGSVVRYDALGAWAGETALRVLNGAPAGSQTITVLTNGTPLFDWRALRRWGIRESRLPPGSIIEFRQRTLWELYRWHIVGVVVFCLFQAALIVGLLVNRAKRRRGEAEATLIADISSKFVNLPASEVDREIEGALRRVCEFIGIDLAVLWQWSREAPDVLTPTQVYFAQEGLQPPEPMRQEHYPYYLQQVLTGRTVGFSSPEELPAEAAVDLKYARLLGIKSNLCLPLSVGGEPPVGALALNTLRAQRDWPDALVKRLQLVAQIFTTALARKRADQALRESELRLSLAAESAEAGLWELDCRTGIFWATEKARAMFGYSPDEVITLERLKASVHPEDWTAFQGNLDRSVGEGAPVNLEYRIRLGDGRTRWIASRGRPHFRPGGEAERVMGSSIDITERKRAEAAFRASEARLAAGTDLAGLGYYEVEYDERTCFMDDRFRDICGVPPDLLQGFEPFEFWLEHVHPDDRQLLLDERQKLHDGRVDRISAEYRYLHPTQGQKWVHHLARIAGRSATGAGVRTFGVVRDVTERKRMLERLESAAKEWQATFDSISDMVMILDREYRIIRVNGATVRFLGLAMERIVGRVCCTLMHGTSCPIEGCPCQKTIQTKLSSQFEVFFAGSGKWLLFSMDPIQDAAGNVIGVVHVARDITEAKRAEGELLRQRMELAHIARVSTMGELAASLAHELNQPLGAILANAEAAELFLGQDPPAMDEVRPILTAIRKDDERAAEVIRRMRALLRKRELERQPLEINSLVEDVLQLVSGDAALRGVSVTTNLTPALPKVSGDRVHLQQVLLNLILNGMDAMANHQRENRQISVRTQLGADGQLELAVMDSGHGIEPDKLPRVFDPFYTTKPSGMGMGLSIARTIIDAHHGRIWAENNASGGATFRITLPASGKAPAPRADSANSAPPSSD